MPKVRRSVRASAVVLLTLVAGCTSVAPSAEPSPAVTPPPAATPAAAGPDACGDAKLVWADALERLLLVGCVDQTDLASVETIWAWDGESWELLDDDGPPANVVTGFGWDAGRDVLVRYGGIPLPDRDCLPETWEWDTSEWRMVEAEPPRACDHIELAWDGVDGRLVLFGGGRGPELDSSTWAWDGTSWVEIATDGPPPRAHHGMVGGNGTTPDGRPVIHGGFDGSRVFGDSWAWDGSAWVEDGPSSGPGPGPRSHHGYAVEVAGSLVFGGATTSSTFSSLVDDTWFFDLGGWRQIAPDEDPSARALPALGWDAAREVFLLYGGFDAAGDQLADTWEFDGQGWTCLEGC